MPIPQLPITSQTYSVNWTVIITVIAFCITAMATIINLFGAKRAERMKERQETRNEEERKRKDTANIPGKSSICQQHEKDMNRVEDLTKDNKKNLGEAQKIVNEMRTQVATLEKDNENINKTMGEMKENNKEIAKRLDGLLSQLMDWMNS